MKPGDSITLPGTDCTIRSEDAVDPSIKGRKVRGLLLVVSQGPGGCYWQRSRAV